MNEVPTPQTLPTLPDSLPDGMPRYRDSIADEWIALAGLEKPMELFDRDLDDRSRSVITEPFSGVTPVSLRVVQSAISRTAQGSDRGIEFAIRAGLWLDENGASSSAFCELSANQGFVSRGFIDEPAAVQRALSLEDSQRARDFATLTHASKLRTMFRFRPLQQFLDNSTLSDEFTEMRAAYLAFAGLALGDSDAESLLEAAWSGTEQLAVRDICVHGLFVATGMPVERQGELLIRYSAVLSDQAPAYSVAQYRRARGFRLLGRFDEGIAASDKALELLVSQNERGAATLLAEQFMRERELIAIAASTATATESIVKLANDASEKAAQVERTAEQTVVRTTEVVAIFTAAIAFVFGSLNLASGSTKLLDKVLLLAVLGFVLVGFLALVFWVVRAPGRSK